MKIYILTCLVIFLIACSNPESSQLVSDRIKIVSPQNGIWVAEEIPIEVELSDGETAKMIELWVNGRAHHPVDYSRPYSFNWSTINYPDSSTHELFVRVYYSDNRRIDSEKVNLHVDNSSSRPRSSNITSIEYVGSTFVIQWTTNEDEDFSSYNLYESQNEDMGNARLIHSMSSRSNTSFTVTNIIDEQDRYYQLFVEDIHGLSSGGNIKKGSSRSSILFISDRQGDDEIFQMLSDGSDQFNLTNRSGDDYYPVFSPDRSFIAFISEQNGNQEIFVMTSNGKEQNNLSNYPTSDDNEPSFSRDGLRVVFTSYRNLNAEIYSVGINGEPIQRLTSNLYEDNSPHYFPDNQHIVFVSDRTGNEEIFIMDIDGNNPINLSNDSAKDTAPVISGDGSKIVFLSNRSGSDDIYLMDSDGSNQQHLTTLSGNEGFPSFSPDGLRITFQHNFENNHQVFIMDADGSNQVNLFSNSTNDIFPQFLRNSQAIIFQTQQDGNYEIYRINLDGNGTQNLSQNPAADRLRGNPNNNQE